jgi:hypothetical protein
MTSMSANIVRSAGNILTLFLCNEKGVAMAKQEKIEYL